MVSILYFGLGLIATALQDADAPKTAKKAEEQNSAHRGT